MSDEMNPFISMVPVIDLSSVDNAYSCFLESCQSRYINWNTGDTSYDNAKDLNEELIRKGVPSNLNCLLKVF